MTKQAHTPGPWKIAGATHIYAAGPLGANIASVSSPRKNKIVGYTELDFDDGDRDEAFANARLIAAAPDLLAVVAGMLGAAEADCMDDKSNVWRSFMIDARAAIAKATGAANG